MFAKPRPKKSILPPPSKKRKATHTVEEITFDDSARQEYLTGFHKRKVQRQKHAQEEAAKKAREEKIEFRKQLREDRKKQVEEHVKNIEAIMKESKVAGLGSDQEGSEAGDSDKDQDEWNGIEEAPEAPVLEAVDHEDEYIDEDLYTTVKVEAVSVDRDGLHNKTELEAADEVSDEGSAADNAVSKQAKETTSSKGRKDFPTKKKKKFRYETKVVRQMTNKKNKDKARKPRG